jgi:hypothetical protein
MAGRRRVGIALIEHDRMVEPHQGEPSRIAPMPNQALQLTAAA